MRLPTLVGLIRRRILINYRVEPDVLARLLPGPFRPRLIGGRGMAGICLIRLERLRPLGAPGWLGLSSENGAQRALVEWDADGMTHQGVYIWRRDTDSWLNVAAGGRVFPGVQHHARFAAEDHGQRIALSLRSGDGQADLEVCGQQAKAWPADSVFGAFGSASQCMRGCSLGYSPNARSSKFHGMQLDCERWPAEPFEIEGLRSAFFDDPARFPPESLAFDSALVMRDIPHRWQAANRALTGQTNELAEIR